MNRLRFFLLAAGTLLSSWQALFGEEATIAKRSAINRLRQSAVCTTSYTVEVPVLARVQGTAFFRTFVAITNNLTTKTITARYQLSYTCVSSSCSPVGGFYRTTPQTITLPALGSFVQDDFIDYLNTQGLLQPGANQGTIATLDVTFDNLPSCEGWEANAIARTYNRIVEADPTQGTVGFAYNASLFFDSAHVTLVGFARDTKSAPTIAGKLRSNVGIRNTDICGANAVCPGESAEKGCMTVDITAYDTVTGKGVGKVLTLANLHPAELRQISDLWATAEIPATDPSDGHAINSVIVFAKARDASLTTPTMEGYVTIIEGFNTQDAAFFSMVCGDTGTCDTCP
jgi:hypothetical protein